MPCTLHAYLTVLAVSDHGYFAPAAAAAISRGIQHTAYIHLDHGCHSAQPKPRGHRLEPLGPTAALVRRRGTGRLCLVALLSGLHA